MDFLKSLLAALLIFWNGLFSHQPPALPTPTVTPTVTMAPTFSPTLTATPGLPSADGLTPTPTRKIIVTVSPTSTGVQTQTTSEAASAEGLFLAMNDYRKSHGLNAVNKSSTLCAIAQTRANQQASLGHLDDHTGFQAAAQSQTEFKHVGELLQYWSAPETAAYLVNTGWGQSGEHIAIMTDPTLTDGCGAMNGYYSVFIFGRR